jgi:hypothetical protein
MFAIEFVVLSCLLVTETSVVWREGTFSPVHWLMYICKSCSQINFLGSLKPSVKYKLNQASDRPAVCPILNIEPRVCSQQIVRGIYDKPSSSEIGYSPSTFFSFCYLPFNQSFTFSKPYLGDEI